MNDHDRLIEIHTKVCALHVDWFGNGQEGGRMMLARHDERLDGLDAKVDGMAAAGNRKAALVGAITAIAAAIGTVFTKDKVGG